jgi:superoxide dismutase, Cu-Zn family
MMIKASNLLAGASAVFIFAADFAFAQQANVDISRISESGVGEKIGTVVITEDISGLSFKVAITGLPEGKRGFHVHEKGDCGPAMKDGKMTAGIAAGEHYDPEGKKSHKGPEGLGHKGDLPALTANAQGKVDQVVAAPRLKLSDILNRSLMIHEGGDTYSDTPESGGGKGRIACGVIPKQ